MAARHRAAIALVGLILAVAPASAAAQNQPASPWTYMVEVFGDAANGRLYLGDSLWGSGPDWGVGAEVRPLSGWLDRLGFEIQLARLTDVESPNSQVSSNLKATLVVADARYHFRGHSRIQPYVFGGLAHINADYTYSCTDCVFDPDPVTGRPVSRGVQVSRDKGSKTGFAFGAGVAMALQRHVSIRPEVLLADTTPGSGYNWAWMQVQIGVGVRF